MDAHLHALRRLGPNRVCSATKNSLWKNEQDQHQCWQKGEDNGGGKMQQNRSLRPENIHGCLHHDSRDLHLQDEYILNENLRTENRKYTYVASQI